MRVDGRAVLHLLARQRHGHLPRDPIRLIDGNWRYTSMASGQPVSAVDDDVSNHPRFIVEDKLYTDPSSPSVATSVYPWTSFALRSIRPSR